MIDPMPRTDAEMPPTREVAELRAKIERLQAEVLRLRAEMKACEPYIKHGQSPSQRLRDSNQSAAYWKQIAEDQSDHIQDLQNALAAALSPEAAP